MRVFVDDRPVDLLPGMTVRHALVASGISEKALTGRRVVDAWGNEIGLGGSLSENARIYVRGVAPAP